MNKFLFAFIAVVFIVASCKKEDPKENTPDPNWPCGLPTQFELVLPANFEALIPPMNIPDGNAITVEGVELGRKLFFEELLSGDGTQSCASCHAPAFAFTDNELQFSIGIDGIEGNRNSMPVFNIGYHNDGMFWDGRAASVEDQAFGPVVNPIELNETWPNVVAKLLSDPEYPDLFCEAFGIADIDSVLVVKAIAQFERTMISGNSKFDKFQRTILGLSSEGVSLSPMEAAGFVVFMDEDRGDCFHCHGDGNNPLWTDNIFHNNGLDATFTDPGLGAINGDPNDIGLFKTPSLRNLAYSAPYMHDGRFATLEEVIEHYSTGLVHSTTIDPLMKNVDDGGAHLTPPDKEALKAFLLSLSDDSFITNPNFHDPN